MADKKKKRIPYLSIIVTFFLLVIVGIIIYFNIVTRISPPEVLDKSAMGLKISNPDESFYKCKRNWLKKSNTGLWELYLEGSPFERGVMNGKLSHTLIRMQEEAFVAQIDQIVPSRYYQVFFKYLIYWFNRNLDRYIPKEYKLEVYGISLSASRKYSFIGSNYQRLLNYHSAYDIGNSLEQFDFKLIGCTSFGVWNAKSKDSTLLIGRNFDFDAGEEFARNKVVCFQKPDRGYAFMTVTWGGMIGTISGMNEKGLTITINAAKSSLLYSARMPVTILAREILQYAKTIDAAYAIAKSRECFISESFLIGSAEDNRAAIIEKSPNGISLYSPNNDYVICTNHFQSQLFTNDPVVNSEIAAGSSLYRYKRVLQKITDEVPLDERGVAKILRDQKGLNEENIGMGNEKSINQLIAHHSIIFKPSQRLVWVSTGNWQLGPFVCYDLNKIFHKFAGLSSNLEITEQDESIPPDPFFVSENYQNYRSYKEMKEFFLDLSKSKEKVTLPGSFISEFLLTNPQFYDVYSIVGDYYFEAGEPDSSAIYYRKALSKVIPEQVEKARIINKLSSCIIKLKSK